MTGLAVRPRLLSEEIYSTLRNAIVEERLPPGMKIVEERLAGELGVSRIPLREALHKLERDGFVESLAHRGFRVIALNAEDIQRVYEIREMLEVPAAAKATASLRASGFGHVEVQLRAMEDAIARGEEVAVVGHHVRFHHAIYEAGDNPRLVELLGPFLEFGFTFSVLKQAGAGGWQPFLDAHRSLLDVLRSGDQSAVAAAMTAHLRRGKELALAAAAAA